MILLNTCMVTAHSYSVFCQHDCQVISRREQRPIIGYSFWKFLILSTTVNSTWNLANMHHGPLVFSAYEEIRAICSAISNPFYELAGGVASHTNQQFSEDLVSFRFARYFNLVELLPTVSDLENLLNSRNYQSNWLQL